MGGIDLDLVVESRLHGAERGLGLRQERLGLDVAKADRDTRCVGDGVGARLDDGRAQRAGRRLEDEVEGVVRVQREPRELGRGVAEGVGDGGEALAVAPDGEAKKLGLGELQLVPLERDLRAESRELTVACSALARGLTLVCVVLRMRRLGGWGSSAPNSAKMSFWRSQKDFVASRSAAKLREQAMLTMDPGPTPAGSSSEGNSMRWTDCGRDTSAAGT